MTCYCPKPAKMFPCRIIDKKTGEIKETRELRFISWYDVDKETPFKDNVTMIPCGKCEGCRIDKANDWATRCILESKNWAKNCFLTLTYDNEHLPKNRSLVKKDLQNFWKRLRKTQKEPIRYLACGEYGPKTLRPHYHAAVFNYIPTDLKTHSMNVEGDLLYTSKKLEKIWGNGYVIIGQLTYKSAAYVARYVLKKAYGATNEWNTKHGRQPEFTLSSRRGGLGINAFNNKGIWEQIKRNNGILIKLEGKVIKKKIPQFLKNKWKELDNREEYYKAQDERTRAYKTIARTRDISKNIFQYQKDQTEKKQEQIRKLDKRQDL